MSKEPDQRWQSVHDLKLQLEALSEMGSKAGVPSVVVSIRRGRERLVVALAILGWTLALGGVLSLVSFSHRLAEERRSLRAEVDLPPSSEMAIGQGSQVAISPDGSKLAFPARTVEGRSLWVRNLETGQTMLLPGTQGAIYPFWAPDSRTIAFFSNGKLRTIPASGGPVQIICDAADGRGGSWSQTGIIVFTPNISEALYKVSDGGGTPVQITKLAGKGLVSHRNPLFLPDGKHFLFVNQKNSSAIGDLYASSSEGGEPKLVVERASNAGYAQGYLLYLRDGNLVAQHFDLSSLTVKGNPIPVSENVEYWQPKNLGNFSISPTGTLVYRLASSSQSRFAWTKLAGEDIEEFGDAITGITPPIRISADGKKIAFFKREAGTTNTDLWVMDVRRRTMARQTFNASGMDSSAFSPDGDRIAFTMSTGSTTTLKIKSLVAGTEEELTPVGDSSWVSSWTPDGKYLVITNQDPKTLNDIYAQTLEGGKIIPVLTQPYNEQDGQVSQDGKWMAYLSNESGRTELYVTDFPLAHSKRQISADGASWHSWSQDGKRLYFANGTKLLATEIIDPETMELGKTEILMNVDNVQPVGFARDGRLLLVKAVSGVVTEPLRVVFHFPQSLEK